VIWLLLSAAHAEDLPPPTVEGYPDWLMWAAIVGIPAITAALGGIAKALIGAAGAFGDLRAEVVASRAEMEGMLKLVKILDEKGRT